MKKILIVVVVLIALLFSGCARARAQGEFAGSTYGGTSTKGDWVVISQSGGEIMDVWIIQDSIVTSAMESDGWIFIDSEGIPTAIGGDVKVLRAKERDILSRYHEYHMEFENKTYREKYSE